MAVYHSSLDAAEKIFLKHFLGFFGMTYVAYILFVHGVEVAALYPALAHFGFYKLIADAFVGVHYEAFGIWNSATYEDACHAFTGAVFYTVTGVDHEMTCVLKFLKFCYGTLLATHVDYDLLLYLSGNELLFAVSGDGTSAFAQLIRHEVEYGGIVADVIGRECARSHNACYIYVCHGGVIMMFEFG